ncbi:MAG TPA: topoisomerase DNA-binding C4 zinc finger domain-containing protein, partial [Anaerolineales bacterium]
ITEYFPNIVDVGFTARMEEDLDRIASGVQPWVDPIKQFYTPFSRQVADADARIPEMKKELEPVGRDCPESGHALVIRYGRYGKFISCSNFPDCRYTEPWLEKIGVQCPQDGGEIVERKTRKGRVFYGCANYPNCDFTSWKRPLPAPCPNCQGLLVVADRRNAQCLNCAEQYPLDQISADELVESA